MIDPVRARARSLAIGFVVLGKLHTVVSRALVGYCGFLREDMDNSSWIASDSLSKLQLRLA